MRFHVPFGITLKLILWHFHRGRRSADEPAGHLHPVAMVAVLQRTGAAEMWTQFCIGHVDPLFAFLTIEARFTCREERIGGQYSWSSYSVVYCIRSFGSPL